MWRACCPPSLGFQSPKLMELWLILHFATFRVLELENLKSRFQTMSLKLGFKPSEGFEITAVVWGKVPGII